MYEYDRNLAYIHIADAARLYRMGDDVTGLRLKLADMFAAPRVVRELASALGGGYYIDDWTRKHANFFRSIQLTKSALFIILLLVVGVAAFNIISTLVMVVKDKRSDIAILRTLGASPRSMLSIFLTQGVAIGVIGTLSGVLLGVLISVNLEALIHGLEALLGLHFLDAKVYFITDLPARVEWSDVLQISLHRVRPVLPLDALSVLARGAHAARPIAATRMTHTMPNLVLTCSGLVKHFEQGDARVEVLNGVDLRDRSRRAHRDRRRFGLRQDDAAAAARRPRSADGGHGVDRRPGDQQAVRRGARRAAQSRAGLRLPVPSPAAGIHRAGKRGDAAADSPHARGRGAAARGRVARARRAQLRASIIGPGNCRAASGREQRSRARWSRSRPWCSPMSRPAISTARTHARCSS